MGRGGEGGGNRLKKMHHLVENLAAFSSNFFISNFVLNGIIIGPCVCCYEMASQFNVSMEDVRIAEMAPPERESEGERRKEREKKEEKKSSRKKMTELWKVKYNNRRRRQW